MTKRIQKVSIEKIAKEKLSKQEIKDIDSIDVETWQKLESGLFLKVSKRLIELRLNYITSTKKFITWIGAIATVGGAVITILKWLTPVLVEYFTKPP